MQPTREIIHLVLSDDAMRPQLIVVHCATVIIGGPGAAGGEGASRDGGAQGGGDGAAAIVSEPGVMGAASAAGGGRRAASAAAAAALGVAGAGAVADRAGRGAAGASAPPVMPLLSLFLHFCVVLRPRHSQSNWYASVDSVGGGQAADEGGGRATFTMHRLLPIDINSIPHLWVCTPIA